MFEARIYSGEGATFAFQRSRSFATFSTALDWAENVMNATELDEFENSEEFEETGEYPFTELFYEILGI